MIKSKANFIKVEGYQHGIFSNQLLWLDIIYKIRDNLNYLPHIIKAFHLASLNDYKSKIKSKKIKFYLLKKKISTIFRLQKFKKRRTLIKFLFYQEHMMLKKYMMKLIIKILIINLMLFFI